MLKNNIKNQKGTSSVETVVLMTLFVSLLFYSFGFFGFVHTAILHNIHARSYVFETFRHRTNLMYFRSNRPTTSWQYYPMGTRLHGINTEGGAPLQVATERPISMGLVLDEQNRRTATHNNDIPNELQTGSRNTSVEVNPGWVMVLYGICLNAECGGGN